MRGVNFVWSLYRSAEALRHPKPDFQQTSLNTTIPSRFRKRKTWGTRESVFLITSAQRRNWLGVSSRPTDRESRIEGA